MKIIGIDTNGVKSLSVLTFWRPLQISVVVLRHNGNHMHSYQWCEKFIRFDFQASSLYLYKKKTIMMF
jgi:hypothetical protein